MYEQLDIFEKFIKQLRRKPKSLRVGKKLIQSIMRKVFIILVLLVNINCLFSQSIQICGDFKLSGYYDSGKKYESTLSLTKTDNGVVAKGAINAFMKEQLDIGISPDIAVTYSTFIKSTNSWVSISFYKKGKIIVSISGINDISCIRIK
jgi:hypothetical protein